MAVFNGVIQGNTILTDDDIGAYDGSPVIITTLDKTSKTEVRRQKAINTFLAKMEAAKGSVEEDGTVTSEELRKELGI